MPATEAQTAALAAARAARVPRVSPFGMSTGSGDRRVQALINKFVKQDAITNADVDAGLAALSTKVDKAGAVKYPEATKPEVKSALVAAIVAAGKTVA